MFRPKIFYLVLVLLICLCATAFASILEILREIIVMFKPGVISLPEGSTKTPLDSVIITAPAVDSVLTHFNPELILKGFPEHDPVDTIAISPDGQVIKKLDLSLIYKIRLPEGVSRDSLIGILETLPEVIYAEPNGTAEFYSPVFPNDQYFGNQWGLYNTGQSGGVYRADINAPEAWEITTGNSAVKIGIIDWGIFGGHSDLSGKVSGDAEYSDPHGTHVAGIASAKTNNSIGVAGVDWNAQLISQNIAGQDITGVYNSIIDAVNSGANVLNNSWGLPSGYSTTVRSAFAYAYKMNRVSTVAMGNDGISVVKYPAGFGQGIIAVGATTDRDVKSVYSNTGNHIDVVAPGGINAYPDNNLRDIYSCWYGEASYRYLAGTSMASPFVTGLASLLKGYKSNLYNDDIEQIIRISADDVNSPTNPGWDEYLGTGRINARKALELLRHPYYLTQLTSSGAYRAGNTGVYSIAFFDVPELAPGVYFVKRYEVRKDVTLPRKFWGTNYVWGRGVATNGYSPESPNFGMGFSDAVPGSITSTTATLFSYVYEVWTLDGDYVGWVPCAPEDVSFAYSALGEPKLLASTVGASRSYIGASPWISVGWTDHNINERGYKLERKDATSNLWSEKASLDSNYTGWTDFNLVGSETYTYRVKSYNAHQISEYSNEKVIKARPHPPTDFEATVECMSYGYPKVIPASYESQTPPPSLYGTGPPLECTRHSNRVFLSWSMPVNQKLPVNYYVIKISGTGVLRYEGPIYTLADTLCLETQRAYRLNVFYFDSEGDTSYMSPELSVTTGRMDLCEIAPTPDKASISGNLPEIFFLGQNYPNPFNLETRIEYGLPEDAYVKLTIYDILGRKVKVLVDEFQSAGVRNVYWEGKNDRGEEVGSGIYFYRIQTGSFTKTAKMSLLK